VRDRASYYLKSFPLYLSFRLVFFVTVCNKFQQIPDKFSP